MDEILSKYNTKESEILQLPHRYLIFIDEVGESFIHFDLDKYNEPSIFPVITITAVIVARSIYQDILIPEMNKIKEYFFKDILKNKSIYFHSREIRRKDGIFKIFLNDNLYSEFKSLIDSLLDKSSITIISSSTNKIKLVKKAIKFEEMSRQKYNTGDIYLKNVGYVLERAGHFLKDNSGKIIFEKRGKKESQRIQAVLIDAKRDGTFYCPKEIFQEIDEEILFFDKKDNISGLQVVDYCTYPFARHAKNLDDVDNKFFDILRRYIYKGDFGEYGLKEWP
ncbi:MAG: DUF3800 domain-containing protein [Candidatus Nealsonbacteria bacterium]